MNVVKAGGGEGGAKPLGGGVDAAHNGQGAAEEGVTLGRGPVRRNRGVGGPVCEVPFAKLDPSAGIDVPRRGVCERGSDGREGEPGATDWYILEKRLGQSETL